jgi:SAM-dependent methyltransferase
MEKIMYSESDPVVKYYDFSFATCSQPEIDFYVNIAQSKAGPCLDLGCGSGILSQKISSLPREVFAVDNSLPMLKKLENKICNTKYENINIIHSSMNNFQLPKKIDTAICRDAFFHNLTPEQQKDTLYCIHESINKNGLFAFNNHYPNPDFLAYAASEKSSVFTERGSYPFPSSSDTLKIYQSLDCDYMSQTITTKLKFEIITSGNTIKSTEYSEWKSRYTFPFEMFHLLEICGFKIRDVFGNYNKEPYSPDTMVIIIAEKVGKSN